MKVFLFLFLISQSAMSIDLEINATSVETKPYLSQFNIKNNSKLDIFCQNIQFMNINYFDNGDYVYALDTQLQNIMINKESRSNFVETATQGLLDIVDVYPSIISRHENMSISLSCEPLNSRLNNIYIYDDLTSCGDNRKVIKKFVLDNGNEKLFQSGEIVNSLSKDAKVFNLESTGVRFAHDNNLYYLISDKLNSIAVDLGNDVFINAFGVNSKMFIITSFNINGLKFTKFIKDENKFKQATSLQTDVGRINIQFEVPVAGKYYINEDEARLKLINQLPEVAKSFSTYLKMSKGYTSISIVFSFKTLKWNVTQAKISNDKKSFVGFEIHPKDILESYGATIIKLDLEIQDDFKILETSGLEYHEMNSLLSNDIFLPITKAKRVLNYKQYKISTRDNKAQIKGSSGTSQIDGLCRPGWIYSDKITDLISANINDRFRGNTLLNMAIKNHDYNTALKLISEGASVSKGDILGRRPLYYAVNTYQFEFVKLLVENGAKISDDRSINLVMLYDLLFHDFSSLATQEFKRNYEFYSYLVTQLFVVENYRPMRELETKLIERFNRSSRFQSLLHIIKGTRDE